MDPIISTLLRPVPGPDADQMDSGRRLLMARLTQERYRQRRPRRFFLRPAGMLAGGLAFGALAVGAAASSGVGLDRTVSEILGDLGVPGVAQDHVVELPRRELPENVPSSAPPPSVDVESSGLQLPDVAQQGEGGAHGEAVSTGVADAIAGSEPGSGRGAAVSQAACGNAKDRATLPDQAQTHGPPDGNPSQDCPDAGGSSPQSGPLSNTSQGSPPQDPGNGKQPVDAPPASPGNGGGNPVGGPPSFPGQGNVEPPVSAPPSEPGPPAGEPGNPVGAPPPAPGQPDGLPGPAVNPPEPGAPLEPPIPDQADPPVDPGTPENPTDAPPTPVPPDITPGELPVTPPGGHP